MLPQMNEWDIFLSHSGYQKGFAKKLFKMLEEHYKVFFDITRLSLPLGDAFPEHIFHATKTCTVALVVLSNEFFCSRWPMMELSAFMDARPSSGVKIVPLFYKLSPQDLKDPDKVAEWQKIWEGFASMSRRIKVSAWMDALRELCSINGLDFKRSNDEQAYLNEIVLDIHKIIPPRFKSSHLGIHGKDRLCKILIDKFEELEQRLQVSGAVKSSKVCLLGVYGLPGSGKTTLCGCLCDDLFTSFAGKVLHLELPTNPTHIQLVVRAKELRKLTNFRYLTNEMMSNEEDLPQVYSQLKDSNLRSSRVFLVIDNISSQDSIEAVQAILRLGVGAGSRVMLVARTPEILHQLLNFHNYYNTHTHFVCDSMRVPSLNENEAVRVLMQPADGLGLDSDYCREMQEKYISSYGTTILKITRSCAFYSKRPHDAHRNALYLPLALKIIGSQLRRNGMDLDNWERQSGGLETMVDEFKEDAVKKMVEESFEKLCSEKQKLLFLDVALFVVPYYYYDGIEYKAAVELLSLMHEYNPDIIERQIKELVKLCFLELNGNRITVHDVFMEFAKGVSDVSSMYYHRRSNIGGMQVKLDLCKIASKPTAALRALILEEDEKCERFDFPPGLSNVKVVVIRKCKSLAALGLVGLMSLVNLEIEECPSLSCVQFDPAHPCTIKSVKWVNQVECKADKQPQGSFLQNLLQMSQVGSAMQARRFINKVWFIMWALHGRPLRPSNGVMSPASHLRALEVLRLHGTGITSLPDLSSYWPQLRVLEVLEDRLEDLELGNLLNLKQFFLGDLEKHYFVNYSTVIAPKRGEARMPKKTNLLAGCPALEDVRICLPSCEDGMGSLVIPSPNLQRLWLKQIYHGEPVLLDFTPTSARSLQEINIHDHRVLKSIKFNHQFLRLVKINLLSCPTLVKITGLECAPNLRNLIVTKCSELRALGNLGGVKMLEQLELADCPVLILTLRGLSNLEFLDKISVSKCPNVQILHSDLENMTSLKSIDCTVSGNMFKLEKLEKLENLAFRRKAGERQAIKLSLCYSMNGEANYEHVNDNAQPQCSMECVPLLDLRGSAPAHLSSLWLDGLEDLVCLDGIDCLVTLQVLWLKDLPKLASLQGLQSLTHLRSLNIEHCMAVTELPSLCTLVGMETLYVGRCVNLTALEGCDKLRSLNFAEFDGCKNLESCPFPAEQLLQPSFLENGGLSFIDCKFASMKALVGWVLDLDVSLAVWDASVGALEFELYDRCRENSRERMQVGEQLVEAVGAHLTRKLPTHSLDTCFDFKPWVADLRAAWKDELRSSYPRGLESVLRGLGGVPCRELLQQCASDAPFRSSVASRLLDAHPAVLHNWIERIREDDG